MRPYLRVANVYEARIDTSDVLSMNFAPEEFERFRLHHGDVLLNEGQSRELVGRPALYRDEVPDACFQNTLVRFQPTEGVNSEWALAVFRTYLHDGTFRAIARWTTNIAHLGSDRFAQLDFPLAPTAEQRRIVEALDSYLTRLDAAAEGLKRVEANLKRYRASVLKAAVEGRLVPTEAALAKAEGRSFEPASVLLRRILDERRRRWEEAELAKLKAKGITPKDDKWKAKYEAPQAPDTSELPELPEGWCWATVEQLAAQEPYALAIGPFGSNLKVSDYRDQGVPLVFVRNIRTEAFPGDAPKFVTHDKAQELRAHTVDGGDLLITKMGDPPGDVAVYPLMAPRAVITADCIKVRPHKLAGSASFLLLGIRSSVVQSQIQKITKGVAQKKVSLERFREVCLPLAPISEQERIASEADSVLSDAKATAEMVAANLRRIERLRQAILKWAFDGKLVDQDPNDEPASVLLERIRAEREAAAKQPAKLTSKQPPTPKASPRRRAVVASSRGGGS